jgi:hypothetical protein
MDAEHISHILANSEPYYFLLIILVCLPLQHIFPNELHCFRHGLNVKISSDRQLNWLNPNAKLLS